MFENVKIRYFPLRFVEKNKTVYSVGSLCRDFDLNLEYQQSKYSQNVHIHINYNRSVL